MKIFSNNKGAVVALTAMLLPIIKLLVYTYASFYQEWIDSPITPVLNECCQREVYIDSTTEFNTSTIQGEIGCCHSSQLLELIRK